MKLFFARLVAGAALALQLAALAAEPAIIAKARALGLETRVACSIIGVGDSPGRY